MNLVDIEKVDTFKCKNCGSIQVQNYCSNCGQKTISKRFTTKSFLQKVLDSFEIEKGFFYVLIMLIKNPGKIINEYLAGRTKIYFNPFNFYIIIAGFSAVLLIWFNIFDASINTTNEFLGVNSSKETIQFQQNINLYIKQYSNVVLLLMLPFISLVSKWVYYKKKLYYGEHLIMNSFLLAQLTAISVLFIPLYLILPLFYDNMLIISLVITIIYYSYALKSIFKNSIFKSVIGAILINLVGYFLFILFSLIMTIIVLIILNLCGFSLKEILQ